MDSELPLYNKQFYSREELIADVSPDIDPVGLTTVLSAFEVAGSVHERQFRDDATPYFLHISRVARIVVRELRSKNPDLIAASLLHDVLEDSTEITADVIKYNFNPYIAYIVEVLTKNIRLTGVLREMEDQRYLERLHYSNIDCKIVKFAERLDNFRCLEFGVKKNPFQYIDETETHYFPMAIRENNRMLDYLVTEMKRVKGRLLA
jgi:GTP diphosphokinase / guanosine-3',5'-bis(diphosphate) 3'-diphosphatase